MTSAACPSPSRPTGSLDGDERPEPIDGYTAEQRLFLGWAAVWQAKSGPRCAAAAGHRPALPR